MRQKLLVFEYLIAIFFSVQILLPLTEVIATAIFISLMSLKYKYEGLRVTYLAYIFIQACLIAFPSPIANISLTLITYCLLSFFPVFEFPETLGPFLVGYKHLTLQSKLNVSVFYPTLQKTKHVNYKTCEDGWVKIYDVMRSYPGHFIPKYAYKLLFGFLEHLDIGTNLDARIISSQLLGRTDKFPVIIFSHGLSANRNLYTGFARQWASYGYIVFCIDHEEPIFLEFKGWEDYRLQRKLHLDARCVAISQVIDFVHCPKEMKKFFKTSTIKIDFTRLSLAGHSFGSAAAIESNLKDNRVTGALILLDPWLFPASDEAVKTAAKRPVLILRSESFASIFEEFKVKEKIQSVVEANKGYSDQTMSCYFKNTTHNSFCDLIVHMPREMKMSGIIQDLKEIEDVYNSQTMLTQIFLDLMLYPVGITELDCKKSAVLKAFESYSAMHEGKGKLEIDAF